MSLHFSLHFIVPLVVMVAGASLAVTSRNILHAVFGLAISLVGVAGAFLVLGSPFVAVMEVLIYIGGIAVTMIFAVMLSSVSHPLPPERLLRRALAAAVAALFFAGGAVVITTSQVHRTEIVPEGAWNLEAVGSDLLGRFNLAFETLSVVLLLAIVGAIVISRKEPVVPGRVGEAPKAPAGEAPVGEGVSS